MRRSRRRQFHNVLLTVALTGVAACGGDGGSGGSDAPAAQPAAVPVMVSATLSGVLDVRQGNVLDGDTNDPRDPVVENNRPPGQTIQIPATVGGYASEPVTDLGETDEFDIYKVTIPGPIKIALSIAEPDDGDLDLLFVNIEGEIIRQSIGTGRFEVIETEAGEVGDFFIAVAAYDGASNYILSLGVATASDASLAALNSDADSLTADAEFVAGEVLVKPATNLGQKQKQSMRESMGKTFGLVEKASSASGVMLMRLQDAEKSTFTQQAKASARRSPFHYANKEAEAKARQLGIIKKLRRDPAVEYAEPNYISHTTATPNDDFFDFQWHYAAINLPQAWDITTGSADVVVAVIDSGVVNHPDLVSNLLYADDGNLAGYDFISDAESAGDGDGIDADPIDIGDSTGGGDSSFHGTHVAGTVAAATNNETGVAGVAWNSRIMPIRVAGAYGATSYDVAQGLRFAAGLANDSGGLPPVQANVVNLSLGPNNSACEALPLNQTIHDSVEATQNAGVIVVVSAGNDDCNAPSPRTTIDGVITVSAVDITNQKASYSNSGASIDVAAPGGDVREDLDGDGYYDGVISTTADDSGSSLRYTFGLKAGTSMAAPHMAGVAALMLAVNPALTANDINLLLAGTHPDPNAGPITQDLGDAGRDDSFGHGLIDAFQAVKVASAVEGGTGGTAPLEDTPVLAVSPGSLNFGAVMTTLPLTVSNAGTGTLNVTDIADDAAWMEVDASDPAALQVTVDRSSLAEGTALGTITITSNGGTKSVPVFAQPETAQADGDIGTAYVLLLDPGSFETIAEATTDVSQGYAYQLEDVAGGTYLLLAGTDRDNDGFLCDDGEACGKYPLVDSPTTITVDGNMNDLDFPAAYGFFATEETSAATTQSLPEKFPGFKRLK